jgi:hypothetical protein
VCMCVGVCVRGCRFVRAYEIVCVRKCECLCVCVCVCVCVSVRESVCVYVGVIVLV